MKGTTPLGGPGWIASERSLLGLSLAQTAKLAGVSPTTVAAIEGGKPTLASSSVKVSTALLGYRALRDGDRVSAFDIRTLERRLDSLARRFDELAGPADDQLDLPSFLNQLAMNGMEVQ